MKKLITILSLALFANVALAVSGGVNAGFTSKLVEQGVVTGTSLVTAGVNVEAGSFGLAVDTFSTFDTNAGIAGLKTNDGWFKRTDVTVSYKFTSTLADVTVGATYKNAKQAFSLGNVKDTILPSVKLSGNAFTYIPWKVTAMFDDKNDNTNLEGGFEFPVPVSVGKLEAVLGLGVGLNSDSADVASLVAASRYYQSSLGLVYPSKFGTVRVDFFVQNDDLSFDSDKFYGWRASYNLSF